MEQRFDNSLIAKTYTNDAGFLIAENAVVTRTGVFTYLNADGSVRKELRHPDDILKTDSLNTLKLLPVTLNHPNVEVTKDNYKDYQVGSTGDTCNIDGKYISVSLSVQDAKAIRAVKSGSNQQLSLGYSVNLVKESGVYDGVPYDYKQTDIKYNHLALVEKARAGDNAKINFDSADIMIDAKLDTNHVKEVKMSEDLKADADKENFDNKEKMDAMKKQMDQMKEKMDKLMAERDSYKDKLDKMQKDMSKKDSQDEKSRIDAMIADKAKDLFKLNSLCKDIDKDFEFNVDTDELTIKKEVLTKVLPNLNLDGKDSAYINARFEILHEDSLKEKEVLPIAEQRAKVLGNVSASRKVDSQSAREKFLDRLQNAYKKES